jgi:hypothetical protein
MGFRGHGSIFFESPPHTTHNKKINNQHATRTKILAVDPSLQSKFIDRDP